MGRDLITAFSFFASFAYALMERELTFETNGGNRNADRV